MVFVPPDRTWRRERASRVVAAAVLVVCAMVCLAVVAFGGGDGTTRRIAVVHRESPASGVPPAQQTSTGATTAVSARLVTASWRSRLPLPAHATRVKAHVPTWHTTLSLAATKRFYVQRLGEHDLSWRPRAVRAGARVVAWTGPVGDVDTARTMGRLTVRTAANLVMITAHR